MDDYIELRSNARDQRSYVTVQKVSSQQTSQDRKLPDRFRMTYDDSNSEMMKYADDVQAPTSGNYQLKWRKGKATGDDELVKYMHNLPSYLEKGENLHDKVLSVGVLDWGQLEKWQCNHKQVPIKSRMVSPPSSNASPLFTTDRSSANSSGEQSCSTHQSRHRPTLDTHLGAFPKEGYSEGVQLSNGNSENNRELKSARSSTSKGREKLIATDHSSCKNNSGNNLEHSKSKEAPVTVPERGISSSLEAFEVKSQTTRKIKIQDGELTRKAEKPQVLNSNFPDKGSIKRPEAVVLILPKGSPQVSDSRVSPLPGLKITTLQRSSKSSRGSFSGSSYSQGRGSYSDCSCTESQEGFSESSCPQDTHLAELNSEIPYAAPSLPNSNSSLMSHRDRNTEEKPIMMAVNSTENKPFESPVLQKTSFVPKVRNHSPARQFSTNMGNTSRNSCIKEDSAKLQLSPNHVTSKLASGKCVASPSLDSSSNLKQNAATRARARSRSSPLRRLLDPLVKPKAVNFHSVAEPLQEDLKSTERASKSSHGRLNSTTTQSVKVKLDFSGCRTVKVINSCQNEKHKSPAVHALLRVAVKNGLPLFTLAVDNESDVLAATGGRLSTPWKDDHCWTYTFIAIREIKKKNGGWMNQGGKDKHHGYIPNVARMKVSDSLSNLDPTGVEFRIREFVLFSADQKQADQQSLMVQPNDELAAIVMKIPRATAGSLINDRHTSGNCSDLPAESGQNGILFGSENPSSMTVILPNGVHSVPAIGEPSSLIERWKSGGSCDCGGWDLGCKLRVLANENQRLNTSSSFSDADPFDLFDQDEVQENQPVFTLEPFKDGIYSVEFSASLSHLQAFSICIAVLDGREFFALPQQNHLFDDEIKASDGVPGELPAKYVSYPPLSPAGRV